MTIGEAAKASGVSAKMLRYYESIGLVPQASRTVAGYRTYGDREVATLRFIRRARSFGLPMARVKLLVGLWQDKTRPSRDVKAIALQQVAELESEIAELTAMKDALAGLAQACRGDGQPDCPILDDLARARQPRRPPGQGQRFGASSRSRAVGPAGDTNAS